LEFRLPGVVVDTCSDPTRAVSLVRERSYAVILCDLWMPTRNGLELLPELRLAAPDATVILMSAVDDEAIRHHATRLGAATFIAKPFDRDAVCAAVRRCLTPLPQEAGVKRPRVTLRTTAAQPFGSF